MADSRKTYYYRDQPTIIKSFLQQHGEIEILVEIAGKPQKFVKEDGLKLEGFLSCFKEVPVTEDPVPETQVISQVPDLSKIDRNPAIYNESKEQFASLTKMLMEDITKVRQDPKYVNQAKQVCNNVSAIVNVTKLQLQLLKQG